MSQPRPPFPRIISLLLLLVASAAADAADTAVSPPEPRAGDTFLFYGGGMVERLLESGHLEAQLQLAHPGKKLRVRSLAWTGDEVGHRLRPEGYVEHLKGLLAAWPANVVVLGFGANEAFAGPAGLPDFRRHYETFLREVDRLHPGARVVLLAPAAPDERSDPRATARRADVAAYAAHAAHFGGPTQAFLYVEVHAEDILVRELATKDYWKTSAWTDLSWRLPHYTG